jgi:hypothetical protein
MSGNGLASERSADRDGRRLSAEARRLAAYLRARVDRDGPCYLKSRDIAGEIDLSPKQVGSYMAQLQDRNAGVSVEPWGYTNGTTWYVSATETEN